MFSHGYGWSMDGYAPPADHWAADGFVVVQPTHLDSRRLGIPAEDPRTPHIWRLRVDDLRRVLDGLAEVEAAVPGLRGRVDHERIAVAGHSWGAQTASTLLGARVLDADGEPCEDLRDPPVRAGVLLAVTGLGDQLTPFAAEHSLGGIVGYGVAETTDENPARVAMIQRLTSAYLRSALGVDDTDRKEALTALDEDPDAMGAVRSK